MSEKDDVVYLTHILQAIEKIERLAIRPRDDEAIGDAIERNLGIIGEAANNISSHIIKKFPEIPWKEIIGFRHKLIHDYFGIEADIVWDVVDHDLPVLKQQILAILENIKGS